MSQSKIKSSLIGRNVENTFTDMLKNAAAFSMSTKDFYGIYGISDAPSDVPHTADFYKVICFGSGDARYSKLILMSPAHVWTGSLTADQTSVTWIKLY